MVSVHFATLVCLLVTVLHIAHPVSGAHKKKGKLLRVRAEGVLSSTYDLSVSITIDLANDMIELDLMGPADVYYAVGFGSDTMVNTWTVVVNGDGEDGWFEQTLSNHRAGILRNTKSFEMVTSSIQDVNVRRLHLTQPLSSLQSFHPFDLEEDDIDVIWAVGSNEVFALHTAYGAEKISYSKEEGGLWIDFGDLSLSALVLVIGIACLVCVLIFYWCWRLVHRCNEPVDAESVVSDDKQPLLRNIDSNNRYIII